MHRCCRSVTFCMGTDPDSDADVSVIDLQDANKKIFFFYVCLLITFCRYIYTFFKDKSHKEVTNQNQGFSDYFCLLLFVGTFTSFFKDKKS